MLGGFPALSGVSCEIARGEVVLLSGPNGAGKTTFLRVLAGLARLSRGEARVLGFDVGNRALRQNIAFISHADALYDDLTVRENLDFAARMCGHNSDVRAMFEQFLLEPVAGVRVSQLSAGQRQRAALAAGWVRDAALLLLDEPHAGLDEHSRVVLDMAIKQASKEGKTICIASHERDHVLQTAHRELSLIGGRMVQANESLRVVEGSSA